jgi:hypothetical protein
MKEAIGGAIVMALVSTIGDFVWATWIPRHRPIYGLTHGTVLFLCLGLYLGALTAKPALGAVAGALTGFLAAGSFYVLAPFTGYWVMFLVWIGVWVAFGFLNGALLQKRSGFRDALVRGVVAAVASGIAFYAVSGIWFPFRPRGWDYAVHFASWTLAYLPGLAALLVTPSPRYRTDDRRSG